MAAATGGASYKTGIVFAARPGLARVSFPDLDGLVSGWLPLTMRKTLRDKECLTLDVGEQVACLMDETFDDGCIVGAIYSDVDRPPIASPDKLHLSFRDGGSLEYDRASGTLAIVASGPVRLVAGGLVTIAAAETLMTGNVTVQGRLTYQGGLLGSGGGTAAQILGGIEASGDIVSGGVSLRSHAHMEQGDGAPTSPPTSPSRGAD
ncbi:phage baseplate assembly protein V [Chromobacterium subtsugae]|uniref:phage baseplate assembly protein V n=1 Tax=Chromobacterium subtsugae TaxID=251747 RepID=UPI0006417821|nr:phage baseplate assembly protein V [Chromobacterium subtsugae]